MLIGSTNTPGVDVGKLRVTLHHNRFANVGQRAPRVRFGQVDVYNNYFYATDEDTYSTRGASACSRPSTRRTTSCLRSADIPLDAVVFDWGGTVLTEIGTLARVGTQKHGRGEPAGRVQRRPTIRTSAPTPAGFPRCAPGWTRPPPCPASSPRRRAPAASGSRDFRNLGRLLLLRQ
jgi:hypothetical protein